MERREAIVKHVLARHLPVGVCNIVACYAVMTRVEAALLLQAGGGHTGTYTLSHKQTYTHKHTHTHAYKLTNTYIHINSRSLEHTDTHSHTRVTHTVSGIEGQEWRDLQAKGVNIHTHSTRTYKQHTHLLTHTISPHIDAQTHAHSGTDAIVARAREESHYALCLKEWWIPTILQDPLK